MQKGTEEAQGRITGQFDPAPAVSGPMDDPASYGGHYWDVGVGLSAAVPGRSMQGDRLVLEWLQPVADHVNGYQLERDGSLTFTWTFSF